MIGLSVGTAFCPEDGYDVETPAGRSRPAHVFGEANPSRANGGQPAKLLAQGAAGNKCRSLRWKIAGHAVALLATVLLGGFLSATLVRLAPGFDADERELDPHLNAQSVQALRDGRRRRRQHFPVLYGLYEAGSARRTWGRRSRSGQPVRNLLHDRIPLTLRLLSALGWDSLDTGTRLCR